VAVTGISADPATRVVAVAVEADLSSLIPGILQLQEEYDVTGYAVVRIDG
jgi:hypothetical protein